MFRFGRLSSLFGFGGFSGGAPSWVPRGDGTPAMLVFDEAVEKGWFENKQFSDEDEFDLETSRLHTRSSVGYSRNKYGFLELQPANVRRKDYNNDAVGGTARLNKVASWNANPFDLAGGAKGGDAASTLTVVDDTAALAAAGLTALCPSGRVFKLDNSAGSTAAYFNFGGPLGNLVQHTISAYVRGTGTGHVGNNGVGSGAVALSAGYTRMSLTQTALAANNGGWLNITAGSVAYCILMQAEEGSSATAPIETKGVATWAYSATTFATPRGTLLEGARTNLLLRSEEFDNASWTKTDITVTADNAIAPNGLQVADLITEGTAGTAQLYQNYTAPSSGAICAQPVYIKKSANVDWIMVSQIQAADANNFVRTWFNITTGVAGSATVGGAAGGNAALAISSLGNGWYRVVCIGSQATLTGYRFIVQSASADASTTRVNNAAYWIWGAQAEAGTFPSSYIPTTSGSATRAADVAAYGPTEATVGEEIVTDKTFASWTKTNICYLSSRGAVMSGTGGNSDLYKTMSGLTIGTAYVMKVFVSRYASGNTFLRAMTTGLSVIVQTSTSAVGWISLYFIAPSTDVVFMVTAQSGTSTGVEVRLPSCRSVPNAVTNPDFSGGVTTGWTSLLSNLTVVSGAMRIMSTTTGAATVGAYQDRAGFTIGKAYTFRAKRAANGGAGALTSVIIRVSTSADVTIGSSSNIASNGAFGSVTIIATDTTLRLWARFTGNASMDTTTYVDFDDFIITEVVPFRGYSAAEMTYLYKLTLNAPTPLAAIQVPFTAHDGTDTNYESSYIEGDDAKYSEVSASSEVWNGVFAGDIATGTEVRVAVASKTNDFAGTKNGGTVSTDVSGTRAPGIHTLVMGAGRTGGGALYGPFKTFAAFSKRITNAGLQSLAA